MDESRRKLLITYCPKVLTILEDGILDVNEKAALIMSALISRIISKGEWEEFCKYVLSAWYEKVWVGIKQRGYSFPSMADDKPAHFVDINPALFAWLISSPAHFAEVVGEAIEQGVLKIEED
jgi:hypothetical protein